MRFLITLSVVSLLAVPAAAVDCPADLGEPPAAISLTDHEHQAPGRADDEVGVAIAVHVTELRNATR